VAFSAAVEMEMAPVPRVLGPKAERVVHTKAEWPMRPNLEAAKRRAATLAAQAAWVALVGVMQVPSSTALMAPREARQTVA
jgi:hypothetical protein